MKSIIKPKNQKAEPVVHEHREGFFAEHIEEIEFKANTDFINSRYKEIRLDGVKIHLRNEVINPPLIIEVQHDFEYIKVHFEIEGNSHYVPYDETQPSILIENNTYNFFYLPKVKGKITYNTTKRKSVEIIVTENYLIKEFKDYFASRKNDLSIAFQNKNPFLLFKESKIINSDFHIILNDIIRCSYQKEIKQIYLESKVREIFSYLLSEMDGTVKEIPEVENITTAEQKRMEKAEKILTADLSVKISISDLANHLGLNQNKLKKNFKKVYDMPIITYLTHRRMEKAREMLLDDGKSIAEIAYIVGYKNPQHFTAAFKRKYNILPRDLRKKALR